MVFEILFAAIYSKDDDEKLPIHYTLQASENVFEEMVKLLKAR